VRPGEKMPVEHGLLERAFMLGLTAPEMTVLVGGLRALGANHDGSKHGVFTDKPETLTNDFFVKLLEPGVSWTTSEQQENLYELKDAESGQVRHTATAADLVFGAHSVLRGISEVYGASDGGEKFVADFVKAWDKVMMLDRYDVKR
jgi:catalase-peroxidase